MEPINCTGIQTIETSVAKEELERLIQLNMYGKQITHRGGHFLRDFFIAVCKEHNCTTFSSEYHSLCQLEEFEDFIEPQIEIEYARVAERIKDDFLRNRGDWKAFQLDKSHVCLRCIIIDDGKLGVTLERFVASVGPRTFLCLSFTALQREETLDNYHVNSRLLALVSEIENSGQKMVPLIPSTVVSKRLPSAESEPVKPVIAPAAAVEIVVEPKKPWTYRLLKSLYK